ncbi:hypothetical protein K2173_016101 [Erythroxylum novogranatense]|uniref:Uncharacterized protein n=1 Tax=Erythroxylum novogranatense TaxID=1862640 RepID=A0AAV8SFV6_9ROSI|nr:hypothetical protein K2173_016101 [Erythroxylum novogranatense]
MCSQRPRSTDQQPLADGTTHEDATSNVAAIDAGVPTGPSVENPTVGFGYGPWVQVQRRPRPSLQRLQQVSSPTTSRKSPAGRPLTSPPKISAIYAALADAGEQATSSVAHAQAPLANPFQGLGKNMAQHASSGVLQAQITGFSLPSNGPQQPSRRGPKGKKGPTMPSIHGESSGTKPIPSPNPLAIPSVQLQPTYINKNIAIIIPSHTEMLCDQQVLADRKEAVEERLQLMEGVEASGLVDPVSTTPAPPMPAPPDPGAALNSSEVLPAPGGQEDQITNLNIFILEQRNKRSLTEGKEKRGKKRNKLKDTLKISLHHHHHLGTTVITPWSLELLHKD